MTPQHPAPLTRAEMLANPAAWLIRLDAELRYLENFTPHAGLAHDHLTILQELQEYAEDGFEIAKENAKADAWKENEVVRHNLDNYQALTRSIINTLEDADLTSAEAAVQALSDIAEEINSTDIDDAFDCAAVRSELEQLANDMTPKKVPA